MIYKNDREQLKNTVSDFDYFENLDDSKYEDYNSPVYKNYKDIKDYQVRDYTSLDLRFIIENKELSEFLNDRDNVFFVNIDNNSLLEEISYRYYNNENYWDIILLINHLDPLFSLPFDFDLIYNLAESITDNYFSRDKYDPYSGKYTDETKNRLFNILKEKLNKQNEINRSIKLLRQEKIQDFLKIFNSSARINNGLNGIRSIISQFTNISS